MTSPGAPAAQAAQSIVDLAIALGSTDNATAVVVRVESVGRLGTPRVAELRPAEAVMPLATSELSVHAPRWLWVAVVLSSGIAIAAVAKLLGLF